MSIHNSKIAEDVKVLMLKGEKGDTGYPTDEQVQTQVTEWIEAHPESTIDEDIIDASVDLWLDEHPEATTTVQDNSLTTSKYQDASITLPKFSDEVITNPSKHFAVNGEGAVTRLGNVALSYINNRDDFVYGGQYTALRNEMQQVDGKWQINCSTFAMLVSFGVTYENSAYQLGARNNVPDDKCCSDIALWDWFKSENEGQSGDERFKYTYDLAEWLYNHGYCFEPNGDLSNIKSGDLLLMKNQTSGGNGGTSTFRDIDHSCIFGYWNSDNMYTVWEVGSLPSAQQYYKSNLEQNCVLVARFPMTNTEEPIENIGLFEGSVSNANNVLSYLYAKEFTPNQYYTFIGKLSNSMDITDAYPVIYQGDTRLGGYNDALSKPDDDIYVIPFVPPVNGSINIRMNRTSESVTLSTTTLEWFNIVEGLHFSHIRLPYNRRVRMTLQSGFTEKANYLANDFLFYAVNGTFASGTNHIGTLSGTVQHGQFTPTFSVCYPTSGVASNIETYLLNNNLMVRNNSGASVTGDLFVAIPIYNK